ncbi:YfaZ family outer membrane protein [Kosakonia radicincitans]|uniref:YfaZ family outer membrane protein n=1 Tax=Kosakonia radicincitans TaxID=283686 RepID=UPI0031D09352
MKKVALLGLASLLLASAGAQAVSLNGQLGKDYSNLGFGFGTETSGIAVTGNWAHSEDDGEVAGLGLGYNLPLGPFLATVGGKGLYISPDSGSDGYAIAVGGGLQWKIASSFNLFGEYYYSPDSLSSGVKEYQEANAGARYTIMRPLTVEAGYRYIDMTGKEGHRDNAVADGPYVGVSASF